MQIINNEKAIKRNARIGQVVTIVSLAILAGGMYLSFQDPATYFVWSLTALLGGFILSQIGIYFTTRWGRRPRPDELLVGALKGLDKRYHLFNYTTPAAHVLIGPAGIWVFVIKHQRGTITFEKNRWKQRGGGFLMGYLKLFAQEGLGRPDLEIAGEIDALQRYLKKEIAEIEIPKIDAALIFTHPEVNIQADETPNPAMPIKKLKEFIRKAAKEKPISRETLDQITATLNPSGGGNDNEDEEE